jgi:hypothetical protein
MAITLKRRTRMTDDYSQTPSDVASRILTPKIRDLITTKAKQLNDIVGAYMRCYGIPEREKGEIMHICRKKMVKHNTEYV